MIIKVLSESTEAFDRGDKFDDYSELEPLQDYLLISQSHHRVDYFQRNQDGVWFLTRYRRNDTLHLTSLDFSCVVSALYEDVELNASA